MPRPLLLAVLALSACTFESPPADAPVSDCVFCNDTLEVSVSRRGTGTAPEILAARAWCDYRDALVLELMVDEPDVTWVGADLYERRSGSLVDQLWLDPDDSDARYYESSVFDVETPVDCTSSIPYQAVFDVRSAEGWALTGSVPLGRVY